jgi:hypothetical protein
MKAMLRPILLVVLVVLAVAGIVPAHAAKKFTRAEVTKIVNEVSLLLGDQTSSQATIGTVVEGSNAVQTGNRSRSELMFPDESVVRLGSNSVFSFDEGKRDLNLNQGTMLLQAPKFHGKTQITTAAVTAAITGTTIMIEYVPPVFNKAGKLVKPGVVKIVVIEGHLEFSLIANPRKKMRLGPGEMAIVHTTDTDLPAAPLIVDLKRMVQTSLLMDGGMGPLPDTKRINDEIADQVGEKEAARLLTYRAIDVNKVPPTGTTNLDSVRKSRLFVNNAPPTAPILTAAPPMRRQPQNNPRPFVPPPVVDPGPNCVDISGPIPEECIDIINGGFTGG